MSDISKATIEGGNIKAVVRLSYPCRLIEDIKNINFDPVEVTQFAFVLKRHREECEDCE